MTGKISICCSTKWLTLVEKWDKEDSKSAERGKEMVLIAAAARNKILFQTEIES